MSQEEKRKKRLTKEQKLLNKATKFIDIRTAFDINKAVLEYSLFDIYLHHRHKQNYFIVLINQQTGRRYYKRVTHRFDKEPTLFVEEVEELIDSIWEDIVDKYANGYLEYDNLT